MSEWTGADQSRAQILLVTTVIVAIMFVGLIGTVYVATATVDERAIGPGDYSAEADSAVHTASYAMEDALLGVNSDQSLTTQSGRETAARDAIQATVDSLDATGQFSGRAISIDLRSYDGTETPAGTRVVQNVEGNLTDAGGNADWTVINGATQTRQASFRVDPYELPSTEAAATEITLTGDTSETVAIYRNGTDVALTHSNGECSVGEIAPTTDDPYATADLIGGTLTLTNADTTAGGSCTDYEPPEVVEQITITDGNQTTGTLGVVSLGDGVAGPNVNSATAPPAAESAADPTAHHVVYGVPVELTVATERTTTTRLIIVAPGRTPTPLPKP